MFIRDIFQGAPSQGGGHQTPQGQKFLPIKLHILWWRRRRKLKTGFHRKNRP